MPRLLARPVQQPVLTQMLATRASIAIQLSRLKEQMEAINAQLLEETKAAGGHLEHDNWKLTVVEGHSGDRISREKLLANGVPLRLIKKATTVGKPFEYVKVTPKTGGPDAGDNES